MARKALPKQDGAFEIPSEEKMQKFKDNYIVKAALARIQKPRFKGRSKEKSPRQIFNGCNSYFTWCEDNDRVPSIKGMMLHMKLLRNTFYLYIQDPEYADILEQAKLVMTEWVENDIYQTPGQAAGKIAYAKNIHGWADRLQTENTSEIRTTTVISVEDARSRIAALAHLINPALLETLAGSYVQHQVTTTNDNCIEINTMR